MFRRLASSLVSIPAVYDLVQKLAGEPRMAERLRRTLATLPKGRTVDVGSSGGRLADRLGVDPVYVDIDVRPLAARRRRGGAPLVLGADACRLPFPDRCFDLSLCFFVSHHLTDGELSHVVAELARVTGGALFFADWVRNDRRALSRLLLRYDRGRNPRTREEIVAALSGRFDLIDVSDFEIYHQYVLCVARPHPPPESHPTPGSGL